MLFLSASVGEGHTAAAQAVCSALSERMTDALCEVVDSYRYASTVFHRVASNGYIGMVKVLPQLYKFAYDQAERATKISAFKTWLHRYTALNLRQFVSELQPDVVVCTHAFPCGVMAEYKREFADAPPVVGIVTDFVVHPFWIHRNIDKYAVATAAMRQTLVTRGVAPARVVVTGIPIDARFADATSKRRARSVIGIGPETTTVLLMGGGLGIGPLENALLAIDRLSGPLQIVVVVGKNKSLERRLREAARTLRHRATVVGFVENVYDYMRAADVLVSKPGGLTSSEALVCELPFIMLRPLPGQEERNTRYLEERGVGIRVERSRELTCALDKLLGSPATLEKMRRHARDLAHPEAARSVASIIESLITRKRAEVVRTR
ncbi:MAG: glycosyltransferase [Candidatus Eremiobacteraeota bacterium]|nr:glycosyltransferase [Candidatus Eremiobacteraeota bacterium]MBV8459617.1 glycosyltransferase [Candidatus Eremiobacteraeota bacterium]MBV8596634.1 glycosyltransferase [Candidatus Eremiobacteraeota bacterium]